MRILYTENEYLVRVCSSKGTERGNKLGLTYIWQSQQENMSRTSKIMKDAMTQNKRTCNIREISLVFILL
jgi:hypothetical protein